MADLRYVETDMVVEEDGAPALVLASATILDPNTKSGNDAHEVATGRFGAKGQPKKAHGPGAIAPPTAPTPDAPDVIRRRDAIVDAARELKDLTPDGVREFVTKRWKGTRVLEEGDVVAFAADARRQRIEDVIDALDNKVRRGVLGVRSARNTVNVSFPRGMIKSTLASLEQGELNEVLTRLRARGWSVDQLKANVVRSFDTKDKKIAAELGSLQ